MLLLALQTTTSAADDSSLDAVTLVLVVIFIASMVAFSVLMRRDDTPSDDERGAPPPPPMPSTPRLSGAPSLKLERLPQPAHSTLPVWLDGVTFPSADASVADAAAVIEGLLSARREKDLGRGLALYTPGALQSLRESFGFNDVDIERARFTGQPPTLRSVEIVSASGNRMTVRAGYSTGGSETYRLARLDDRWSIEEIIPGR